MKKTMNLIWLIALALMMPTWINVARGKEPVIKRKRHEDRQAHQTVQSHQKRDHRSGHKTGWQVIKNGKVQGSCQTVQPYKKRNHQSRHQTDWRVVINNKNRDDRRIVRLYQKRDHRSKHQTDQQDSRSHGNRRTVQSRHQHHKSHRRYHSWQGRKKITYRWRIW